MKYLGNLLWYKNYKFVVGKLNVIPTIEDIQYCLYYTKPKFRDWSRAEQYILKIKLEFSGQNI